MIMYAIYYHHQVPSSLKDDGSPAPTGPQWQPPCLQGTRLTVLLQGSIVKMPPSFEVCLKPSPPQSLP